jgi:hypothetical protein
MLSDDAGESHFGSNGDSKSGEWPKLADTEVELLYLARSNLESRMQQARTLNRFTL